MKGGAARLALYLYFATKLTKSLRKITKGCTEFRVDKRESVETKPRNLPIFSATRKLIFLIPCLDRDFLM